MTDSSMFATRRGTCGSQKNVWAAWTGYQQSTREWRPSYPWPLSLATVSFARWVTREADCAGFYECRHVRPSPARMPAPPLAVHSVMMLPSSSSMLLNQAVTPPPLRLAWQRRTRLPISVRLALSVTKPPPADLRPPAALQPSIVQSSSRALAPQTASPPAKMKQDCGWG